MDELEGGMTIFGLIKGILILGLSLALLAKAADWLGALIGWISKQSNSNEAIAAASHLMGNSAH